jgi:hypothetical protein
VPITTWPLAISAPPKVFECCNMTHGPLRPMRAAGSHAAFLGPWFTPCTPSAAQHRGDHVKADQEEAFGPLEVVD